MVHHLTKSRKSTPISHYGEPYSGIEDYEIKGLTIEIRRRDTSLYKKSRGLFPVALIDVLANHHLIGFSLCAIHSCHHLYSIFLKILSTYPSPHCLHRKCLVAVPGNVSIPPSLIIGSVSV